MKFVVILFKICFLLNKYAQEAFESFCQVLSGFLIFIDSATEDKWLRDVFIYIYIGTYVSFIVYIYSIYSIYIHIYTHTICVMCIFVCLHTLHMLHYVKLYIVSSYHIKILLIFGSNARSF